MLERAVGGACLTIGLSKVRLWILNTLSWNCLFVAVEIILCMNWLVLSVPSAKEKLLEEAEEV